MQPWGGESDHRTVRDQLDRVVSIALRSWQFRWYAVLVLVLGAIGSLTVAMVKPRMYTSETLIVYREGIGVRTALGTDQVSDATQKLALKLKELVLSRTRLQKIIDEYHLYPALVDERGYVEAVNEMRKNIAFTAKDGETFGLSYSGTDPTLVQKLTARLAHDLLEEQSRTRLEAAGDTKEFLDVKKRVSDEDLRDKESALATFISKHPEFARESNGINAGTETGIAVRASAAQKASARAVDPQLAAFERQAARLQERLGIPVKRKVIVPPDADPKLVAARNDAENDLKAAQRELADKSAQFTEEHPDVRAAKARVKAAEAKLNRATDALVPAAKTPADPKPEAAEEGAIDRVALEAELKRVQDDLAAYKRHRATDDAAGTTPSEASSIVTLETEWTRLNREVADAREQNSQLQTRQFNASMFESAVTSGHNAQMIIVDPAYKPMHPAKGRTQIVIAGMAISFALALLLALLLAMLDDRLYDRVDVESLHLAPLLVVVPRVDGKRDNRG
jgi:uncharacterized protein involved in exopolysaccharide biosynthesis